MRREIEAYWEAKRRIERRLLIGAGALLMVIGSAACADSPTGPYTQLDIESPPSAPVEVPGGTNDEFRCGDIQISHRVCEKGLGPEEDAGVE